MRRREFFVSMAAPAVVAAQRGPARPERVEQMTAGPKPAIALNHLGFQPGARKVLVYRITGSETPAQFSMRDIGGPAKPFVLTRPLRPYDGELGRCLAGDFSDVERLGMYQVTVGTERSVPFFIRTDAWRRTLPMAVSYHHAQRCGVAIPNVHPACHLDDARRRDTGEHIDVTGGWHDAGDLRKWMTATMMNGFGLLYLARNLGEKWDLAGSGLAPLLDEMRWGNRYFRKMQDKDGLVWADAAGGLNGDNSDNHWTDNESGNADDRYINPGKPGMVQAMFTALQAMVTQAFAASDPGYGQECLAAGVRCWKAAARTAKSTTETAWWTLAATELYRATRQDEYATAAAELAGRLRSLQLADYVGEQNKVRGFWRAGEGSDTALAEAVYSAIPGIALLETAAALPQHAEAARWRDAVRLYLDEYVTPMSGRSAYAIVPFSVFFGSPTQETYRPLAGKLTYRFFMPVRKQNWWAGLNSHLGGHAALLGMAAKVFGRREYRDLAYRQIEWVLGANPFAASLMTAQGMRNPYPHSRYVGLLPGGIVNGIAGNMQDEAVLDTEYGYDWRTTEYWSPHNAFYLWAHSILETA